MNTNKPSSHVMPFCKYAEKSHGCTNPECRFRHEGKANEKKPCRYGNECTNKNCTFGGHDEVHKHHGTVVAYKTRPCRYGEKCANKNKNCPFGHDDDHIDPKEDPNLNNTGEFSCCPRKMNCRNAVCTEMHFRPPCPNFENGGCPNISSNECRTSGKYYHAGTQGEDFFHLRSAAINDQILWCETISKIAEEKKLQAKRLM
jgi:hypothetical protein